MVLITASQYHPIQHQQKHNTVNTHELVFNYSALKIEADAKMQHLIYPLLSILKAGTWNKRQQLPITVP